MVTQGDIDYLKSQEDPTKYSPSRLGSLKTVTSNSRYTGFSLKAPQKIVDIHDGPVLWVSSPNTERASVGIIYVQTLDGRAAFEAPWKAKGGLTDWYHFREILRFGIDAVGAAKNMRRGENKERPLLLSFYDPDLIKYRQDVLKKDRHPIGVIVTGSGEIDGGFDHLAFTNEGKSVIFTSDVGISKLEKELESHSDLNLSLESIGPTPRKLDMNEMLRRLKSKYGVERFLVLGGPGFSTDLINAGLVDNYFINISAALSGNPNIRSFFHSPDSKNILELERVSIKVANTPASDNEGSDTTYIHFAPKR